MVYNYLIISKVLLRYHRIDKSGELGINNQGAYHCMAVFLSFEYTCRVNVIPLRLIGKLYHLQNCRNSFEYQNVL